ncbi:MAG TPA: glycosyltransferase family 4 protein [Steroidobacteraceae bacterium]
MAAGGAERVAATLANAWSCQGRRVWLISTFLGSQAGGYPLDPRVSTVLLSDLMAGERRSGWRVALCKRVVLRRVIRGIGPDVVVSFLTNVNVLSIAALATSRLPLIVSERTDPAADVELPRALRLARALSYRWAAALVVQTAAAARRYGAQLRHLRGIEVIHNPLPSELHASPLRAQQEGRGGLVIAMGRLTREKGFDTLIAAFGRALADDPSWRLQIWGDGPLRPELAQLVEERHLQGQVQLCGATKQPWAVLAAAQIFMLTSEYEGFPNAMLEAMALGLPCVAFDCPSGPRELADGGAAAVIVPPGDVDALVTALQNLAANPEARRTLGARAAAFVRQKFAEHRIIDDWDRVFKRVMGR